MPNDGLPNKFAGYRGQFSIEQFDSIMKQTQYSPNTRRRLRDYLVLGQPMNQYNRVQRQFLRNKLTDLERRGLLEMGCDSSLEPPEQP